MKRRLLRLLPLLALSAGLLGCKSTLAPGGAYAPTNSVGLATAAPDMAFYQVDAAFDLAYSTVQAAFKFEYDNRAFLWGLSPKIKQTLDSIRPDAVTAIQAFTAARTAYMANPTASGLTTLQTFLAKTQQLAATATAVTANLQTKAN